MDIRIIMAQATESVDLLIAEGWQGSGRAYDIGTYHGDAEALGEKVGRETTREERVSLEHQIREQLDARYRAEVAS